MNIITTKQFQLMTDMYLIRRFMTETYDVGAEYMTGGNDPFYEKPGFGKVMHWYFYKKESD